MEGPQAFIFLFLIAIWLDWSGHQDPQQTTGRWDLALKVSELISLFSIADADYSKS